MTISTAVRIKLKKLATKVAGIMLCESNFVDFMKTILNFAITLEKENKKHFVTTRIGDIVKDRMCPELLTEISA